jgi:cytochrome b561/polyisoprenoid-binding protein YceI
MPRTNTATSYGSVAKALHWTTAGLILAVIPLGIIAHDMAVAPDTLALKATLFSAHKTVGIAIFTVALIRILWALSQSKPAPLHPHRTLEQMLAETVHWLLYGSLVLVPLTGWIHHAATAGYAPIWWPFGQSLPFVPVESRVAAIFAGLHMIFERVMVISIGLHILGALKHHFVDKDDTLRRMLPGRIVTAATPGPRHRAAPVAGAVAIWALAIGAGTGLGVFNQTSQATQVAELAQVETGWQVQSGSLGITVTQFGSAVSGSFGQWTAAIDFAETPGPDGSNGTVVVQIAIGSLTLGSVTDQALGADFFNAEGFPTAQFTADIVAGDAPGSYVAEGVLTVKDSTAPVRLPFTLTVNEDVATMSGTATVARLDYGIGTGYSDGGTVGLDVTVDVALDATRAE